MVEPVNPEVRKTSILFSVCVAVYNVEHYLNECLESLRNLDFKNAEFLVVDDGSTDNSLEIIKHFLDDPRFRLIQHASNKGLLVARKTAVLEAQGDWILFLDGDDKFLRPDALSIIAEFTTRVPADIHQFRIASFEGEESFRQSIDRYIWGREELSTPCLGSENIFLKISQGEIAWNVWNKVWRAEGCQKNTLSQLRTPPSHS